LAAIVVAALGATEALDASRDLTETVDGAGEIGRPSGLRVAEIDGVGRDGPATALVDRTAAVEVAGFGLSDVAFLTGDLGVIGGFGSVDGVIDAVVLVVRTEVTDAADEDGPPDCAGRVMSGRGGPLISLPCLLEGVGLVSLARVAPIATLAPTRAAVGLLALAPPGSGAVVGAETDLADRALATEAVDAELLSRSLLRPGASDALSARTVDGLDELA
jgi:hypothetical protein